MSADAPIPHSPIVVIYRLYAALIATLPPDPDAGLGGSLLYAGDLSLGRDLLFAANIAGAASIAASADPAAQRQAIRDGVVDFVVTSLEEALRILKNEVRKKQAVSVGVGIAPEALSAQMLDRGVLPDLLPASPTTGGFLALGSRAMVTAISQPAFVSWTVDREFPRWLPKLDALVQQAIPPEDVARHRWLRLAPRYLGRIAHKQHGISLTSEEAAEFRLRAAKLPLESDPPIAIQISD